MAVNAMDILQLIQKIVIWAIPVIFAITVHEVSHGWVAHKLGDSTAKMLGRITLNPIKHIDPIGTLLVPGLLILFGSKFIFGWAKPVPVNWGNLRNPKRDVALVALAGPVSNLVMALIWAILAKLGMLIGGAFTFLVYMGIAGIMINLILMILNIIPIPPLDGSRVVTSLLSPRAARSYNMIEPYGFLILLVLLFTGVLGKILFVPFNLLFGLILSAFGLQVGGMFN